LPSQIIYEHPLTERSRTLLRLEHLFQQTDYHLPQENSWNSRAAVDGLLGMASIFSRADLKADFIKELDRHQVSLRRMAQTPGVDSGRLDAILQDIANTISQLQRMEGQLGKHLRTNELLKNVMQRNGIPGASCAFDIPAYHHWLQQPHGSRVSDLVNWLRPLEPARSAVLLLLTLTRGSAVTEPQLAPEGLYQRALDQNSAPQLLRVILPGDTRLFPEISGGKHRFSVRFMESDIEGRPVQTKVDIPFEIALCVF
jgi:cell division protein ZapD